ncbi:MAG: hypothetical protein M3159_04040 [Actinomycetota bacterium]|nr:hypothetical protein [Actinomycetota bacterium]
MFNRVEEWERIFNEAEGAVCVHVLRTKTEVLTLERAGHLVVQRMRRLQARKRSKATKQAQSTTLESH